MSDVETKTESETSGKLGSCCKNNGQEKSESSPKVNPEVEELQPSTLGTKTHWEDVYKDEMSVFEESRVVDEGWFGYEVETKILRYVEKLTTLQKCDPIVDLGCGNGSLLLELAMREYTNLMGIDFSQEAVKLATAVFKFQKYEAKFHVSNILEDNPSDLGKFSLCLDKGTFDAISLCPDVNQKEARMKYFEYVLNIMEDDGIFILTSCNWTESEIAIMSKGWLHLSEVVPTQKFNFGGKPGSLVTIAVMKKKPLENVQ